MPHHDPRSDVIGGGSPPPGVLPAVGGVTSGAVEAHRGVTGTEGPRKNQHGPTGGASLSGVEGDDPECAHCGAPGHEEEWCPEHGPEAQKRAEGVAYTRAREAHAADLASDGLAECDACGGIGSIVADDADDFRTCRECAGEGIVSVNRDAATWLARLRGAADDLAREVARSGYACPGEDPGATHLHGWTESLLFDAAMAMAKGAHLPLPALAALDGYASPLAQRVDRHLTVIGLDAEHDYARAARIARALGVELPS